VTPGCNSRRLWHDDVERRAAEGGAGSQIAERRLDVRDRGRRQDDDVRS